MSQWIEDEKTGNGLMCLLDKITERHYGLRNESSLINNSSALERLYGDEINQSWSYN